MIFADLSHQMHPEMTVWPGDAQPSFTVSCSFEDGGNCRSTLISFTTHTGTHVDAFSHILLDGATMDAIPLERFFGSAAITDCSHLGEDGIIGVDAVLNNPWAKEAKILLFRTGWDQYYNTEKYLSRYPTIGLDLAKWLVENKKSAVGVDALSVDPTESYDMPTHQTLMSGGVLIYENLCGLSKLPEHGFSFYGLPLNLKELDASPVRAIAQW